MYQHYGLVQVARDTTPAISLQLAKAHMRIIARDSEDDYLQMLIEGAVDYLEHITNRTFVNTTYDYTLDSFPYYVTEKIQPFLWGRIGIWLPKNPVVSVTSVKYRDFSNTEITFSDWSLNNSAEPARIVPLPTTVWPYADVQRATPVTIRFISGYSGVLPPRVRTCLLYLIAHQYENREPVSNLNMSKIPYTLENLIRSLRYEL